MKKKATFLMACLLATTTLIAQDFEWAKTFGGNAFDEGKSVSVDASGNVYTTGYFTGTVDFDPGAGTANFTSAGGSDIFVQKLDASGNFLWARTFGDNEADEGNSIYADPLGNVYITGSFEGTVDFDPGTGTANLSAGNDEDVFIVNLDASGNYLWAVSFGGNDDDEGYSIQIDASGNVYTTGYFEGTVDFDPGSGTTNLSSVGNDDIFVQKLNPAGGFLWAKAFGGINDDGGYSISVDASGSVYTTGYFRGTVDFDPGAGTNNLSSAGLTDIFIQKLDASGNFLWAYSFGDEDEDEGKSISLDASGNVYTTGSFEGTVDFDPGAGTTNLSSGDSEDVFIQKLDPSGNFLWAVSFGGDEDDEAYSIFVDASGYVYTTGYFEDTADFDPGSGTANLSSVGASDIFVHKLGQMTTGISEISTGIKISAYPNPTNGSFQLSFEEPQDSVVIILSDLQGRVIYTRNLGVVSDIPLEINGKSGIYFLKIQTLSGQSVIKLIKG